MQPSKGPKLKKKLGKHIGMLEGLAAKFEAKYGPSDPLVRDIAEEIQTLRAKDAENNSELLRGRRSTQKTYQMGVRATDRHTSPSLGA